MLKTLICCLCCIFTSLFAGMEADFFRACLNGENDTLVALYNLGGQKLIHARDKDLNTPLHLACCSKKGGHKKALISFLLEHEADVNAQNQYKSTPLIVAVSNENYEAVDLLMNHPDIHPNLQDNCNYGALQHAVINRLPKLMEKLLSHPLTNPNFGTADGATPLHFAAMYGYIEEAKLLIHNPHINLNAAQHDATYSGATALHFAAMQAQHEIIAELLQYKDTNIQAQINQGLYSGFTPLHFAVMNPDTVRTFESVKLLLEYGANPHHKCVAGKSPKDLTEVSLIKKLLNNPKTQLSKN